MSANNSKTPDEQAPRFAVLTLLERFHSDDGAKAETQYIERKAAGEQAGLYVRLDDLGATINPAFRVDRVMRKLKRSGLLPNTQAARQWVQQAIAAEISAAIGETAALMALRFMAEPQPEQEASADAMRLLGALTRQHGGQCTILGRYLREAEPATDLLSLRVNADGDHHYTLIMMRSNGEEPSEPIPNT